MHQSHNKSNTTTTASAVQTVNSSLLTQPAITLYFISKWIFIHYFGRPQGSAPVSIL